MNGTYTQQELLLLSNFVYIPACLTEGTLADIIGRYRDENGGFSEESVLEAARGGGMSCADVRDVFREMDERIRQNPGFGGLSASRYLEEYDVRAVCFTDAKDKNPVVAFRGTGGTKEAWSDNFEGAFSEDTRIQKVADEFIKNECAIYDDIVVTGHSKGGNLAQYVTVRQKDMIKECVSFDGQGFGDDFIRENAKDIEEAAPKIYSISAYNDFVNILLAGIAGTSIYVENSSSAGSAHSSVTLLTENSFDDEGNIISTRSRGIVSTSLKHLTDRICTLLSPLSTKDKETLGGIAGSAISLALTTPSDNLMEGCVAPTLGMVCASLMEKTGEEIKNITGSAPLYARNVYIDTVRCDDAAALLVREAGSMETIMKRTDEVRQNMAYTITSKVCAEAALEKVCYDLSSVRDSLVSLAGLITKVAGCYQKTEEEALASVNL